MRLLLGLIVAWAALNASLLASAMSDRLLPFGGYLFGASLVIGLAISADTHAAVGGIATWTGINIFRIQCGRIVGGVPIAIAIGLVAIAIGFVVYLLFQKLEAINANIVYLDVFVLIAQTFLKNPALPALAPKQSEMPFVIVQAAALGTFVVLGAVSLSRFRDARR